MTLLALHRPCLGFHRRKWIHRLSRLVFGLVVMWLCSACVVIPSPDESTYAPYGPLTSADHDLLIRVRLAGLWQVPAGREA
jgi:hypothetical protein